MTGGPQDAPEAADRPCYPPHITRDLDAILDSAVPSLHPPVASRPDERIDMLDSFDHQAAGASSRRRSARPELARARWHGVALSSLAAALLLAAPALAQDAPTPAAVTPEVLARWIPDPWVDLPVDGLRPTFDRSGAASVVANYDDRDDERSYIDLKLALTDLGPYRDAAELVFQADVAAGRATSRQVGGYAAYAALEHADPTLAVFADRIWIRADGFGGLFDGDALEAAVKTLPLDDIAALSSLPVATKARYTPLGFTAGALRHFLPETLLGLTKEDGYLAKVDPTGVAWGGFLYGGTHDGRDVRLQVTIWDLGTLSATAEQRLDIETEQWQPFTQAGRKGFVEQGVPRPRVLLDVGRFRFQVEVLRDDDIDTSWLRGAFDGIDPDLLTVLAASVPAPTPSRDPLLGQPELLDPQRLAEALPEQLAGYRRSDIEAGVNRSRRDPYDTAYASAPYLGADGAVAFTLSVLDQGLVTQQLKDEQATMESVEVAGHRAYRASDPPSLLAVVGDRLVVTLRGGPAAESAVSAADLRSALAELDRAPLRSILAGGVETR